LNKKSISDANQLICSNIDVLPLKWVLGGLVRDEIEEALSQRASLMRGAMLTEESLEESEHCDSALG